jgi:hypothetical protein
VVIEPASFEQAANLVGRRMKFRSRCNEVVGENRIPTPACSIEQAGRVERLERAVDPGQQRVARWTLRLSSGKSRAGAKLGSELWMGVEQKSWREACLSEPSHRLAEARRREIEQAETFEERSVGHIRVKRADQLFRDVKFVLRNASVSSQSRVSLRTFGRALQQIKETSNAE